MIPRDPQILVSFVNTQLRDNYSSLEELCQGLSIDQRKLVETLGSIEYIYSAEANRFI